jgi:AcrR family transcriptional regulator
VFDKVKPKVDAKMKIKMETWKNKGLSVSEIASMLGVSRATVYHHLASL